MSPMVTATKVTAVEIHEPRLSDACSRASVSSTSGNTDSDRTYLAGELVARTEPRRVTFGADLTDASEDGVEIDSLEPIATSFPNFTALLESAAA